MAGVISAQGGDAAEAARRQSVLTSGDSYIGDPRLLRDGEPAELETDAYGAAVRNQFWPYVSALVEGNNPHFSQFLKESTRNVPNVWKTMTDSLNKVRDTADIGDAGREAMRIRSAERVFVPAPNDYLDAKRQRSVVGGW